MENLLKLGLFVLCIKIALALQCIQCHSYKNLVCEHKLETCTAGVNESCMIRRAWTSRHQLYDPDSVESKCTKDCRYTENIHDDAGELIFCCTYMDFCNDINIPVMVP
uniref:UPAR/Ly6 domain-containing protein n=1 Tax=Castor canadensis TaxID=51338 RepID=A0A8C0ZR68_CASCN